MKALRKTFIDIEIDKLTKSIENVVSGDAFDTEVILLKRNEAKQIKKSEWLFDWRRQLTRNDRATYKLTIKGNPDVIQGLISLSDNYPDIDMDAWKSECELLDNNFTDYQEIEKWSSSEAFPQH